MYDVIDEVFFIIIIIVVVRSGIRSQKNIN